ncbi:histidinol-phosphatase HisJ [Bacillus shivajii]|uniref:histidinol-phosphatase HisJ n=1 Tax=Bacillus shivajii TaxID=1983719 RepID=UPI001CFB874B|nr:histidinol-phosphatase HisJ [Bacillus shivajii]UCZ52297.1 histidinol-phosphatase HisJ [Bacillus shivajii]
MSIYDGHIHTPYCPHGSNDTLKKYVEKALQLGYTEMTFTEHAPLPKSFSDPVPDKDSAMDKRHLDSYIKDLNELKDKYDGQIKINVGLEVDYIEGFEEEITDFLNEWGQHLDDSILSVHFLKITSVNYVCLDFDEHSFHHLQKSLGSTKDVYELYYDTIEKSISCDLGKYKPKRIGHITLVRKFQELFPRQFDDSKYMNKTLNKMKDYNLTLDVNGAGIIKPYCKEPYPPERWIKEAKALNIPLVYGSDAHSSNGLGQGWEILRQSIY